MTKKLLKSRSKRTSCRQKYKVQKKVKEHLRKTKKEARKNPKSNKKKDPGVPNSLPFKAEVLQQVEEMRAAGLAEKKAAADLQRLVANAQQRQRQHERKVGAVKAAASGPPAEHVERSAKAFHREFTKVITSADVLLEVLDARDPLGSRCRELEEAVLSRPDKRLVLVLNKADLVPREVLKRWVAHLRRELPCVAFRCSTQAQKARIGQRRHGDATDAASDSADASAGGSRAAGVDQLLGLLANYSRGRAGAGVGIGGSVVVGVVGYPNTGKSSLINSLKRARVCPTGATPGLTRVSQEVALDKRVRLLDCPGVVLASGAPAAQLILRNCVRVETIDDPLPAVQVIFERCAREKLMVFYSLPLFNTAEEFLTMLARRMGKLKRGGLPDAAAAGRKVLIDWSIGRLTYYTLPPENPPAQTASQLQLVGQWTKEFNLDTVDLLPCDADGGGDSLGRAADAMDAVVKPLESVAMATPDEDVVVDAAMKTDDEEESAEGDSDENLVVDASESLKSGSAADAQDAAQEARFRAVMAGAQRNRALRLQTKKSRKKAKRLDRNAGKLGGEFEAKMDTVLDSLAGFGGKSAGGAGDYDFDKHFPPKK